LEQEAGMKNILDAGPLIAAINRQDEHHRWACETLERLGPPFYSCTEAVAEAAAMTGQPAALVEMIQSGEIVLAFDLSEQTAGVLSLLKKYADRDMDLADACIVRMTELMRDCHVVTLDRGDFAVYRRNGRDLIPVIAPPAKS
jgi:predicted nucleic acid-binding protein